MDPEASIVPSKINNFDYELIKTWWLEKKLSPLLQIDADNNIHLRRYGRPMQLHCWLKTPELKLWNNSISIDLSKKKMALANPSPEAKKHFWGAIRRGALYRWLCWSRQQTDTHSWGDFSRGPIIQNWASRKQLALWVYPLTLRIWQARIVPFLRSAAEDFW